ncbi:MAG: hypothetical protein ACRD17_10740 [Terriglobales bacterium]
MPPIALPHTALAWSDFVTGCLAIAAGAILLWLERWAPRPAPATAAKPRVVRE